ncbi:MAG TPA: hypothetical protein VNW99_00760 [Cytophagaceae bacterium]|jgi:hypothetical protein|nr:hypothetical protein [Cytophagaceae bacterium]
MKHTFFKEIYIASPCNADWNKMDKGSQSRFCRNCSKTVYDFTKRSEEDLNKLIREKGEHFCGRFYEDQIDQSLRFVYKKQSRIQSFKRFSLSLFSAIALKLLTVSTAFSQEISSGTSTMAIEYPKDCQQNILEDLPYKIEGKVVNESDGKGISGISVKIYSGELLLGTTTTSELGVFTLSMEKELSSDAKIRIKTERKEYKSWSYKTIYKACEIIFTTAQSHNLTFELKIKQKKRIHLKRRRIVMGKFR